MPEMDIKAITDKIDGISETVATNVKAAKEEINANVDSKVKAVKEELDTLITEAKSAADKAFVKADEVDKRIVASQNVGGGQGKAKSFNQVLAEAIEAKTDELIKFEKKESKRFELELKGFDQKAVADVSVGNITGGSVWGGAYRPDIVMAPNRKTHIRSLLGVTPAGPGTDYYFMRENGAGEGSIAPTSEKGSAAATTQATGLKPQFDIDLAEASVKFETIAGFMVTSRKALNNIKGFTGFLQKRIPEKLLNAEDAQILYGNGTSPNIKGILTAGNYVAGSAAGATVLAEKIINDLSLLEDTYERNANGIVMRPADYYSFFKNKAAGSGEYDLPEGFVFVNGVLYCLGIPVVKTTALTANDYVLGDFDFGADLLVQESIRLEFFEQDGTNVRTNQITIRVEETIALPVYGSDYFVKGSSALA
jgi:HK97 family phage major capsid protein